MPSYKPKFEEGEQIIIDGAYAVIMAVEDGEYRMARYGRLGWKDASDIDAVAHSREETTDPHE